MVKNGCLLFFARYKYKEKETIETAVRNGQVYEDVIGKREEEEEEEVWKPFD